MDNSSAQMGQVRKDLTNRHYFYIGFGAIVGTGWVLMVGDWITLGGGPLGALSAFFIGGILLLPIGAAFGELSSAMPVSGGIITYIEKAFGTKISFFSGWLLALGDGIVCPWEALAISAVLSELVSAHIPWLLSIKLYEIYGSTVYLWPLLISLSLSGIVIWQNFRGALAMAKLQAYLTKILFIGMLIAMAASLWKGDAAHMRPFFEAVRGNLTETGGTTFFTAFLSVLVLTPFFYTGLDTIPDQAEEAKEGLDRHAFGRVIGLAVLASALFYVICIYSFSTIIPWQEFIQKPIPSLSVLQDIHPFLALVMLGIATVSPLGPMNALFSATARIILAMGRKRQLPAVFGRLDACRSTPQAANFLLAVLTLSGPFLGYHMILPLTLVAALAFILPCTIMCGACLRLRYTEPTLHRPYRVPGGEAGIILGIFIGCGLSALFLIPKSPMFLGYTEWMLLTLWMGMGILLYCIRNQNKTKSS